MTPGDDYYAALAECFQELFGGYIAEAEAKFMAKVEAEIEAQAQLHAEQKVKLTMELKAEQEARLKAISELTKIREQARRTEEALLQAEAARRDAEWLKTMVKCVVYFFPNAPIKVFLDLQLLSYTSQQHLEAMNLMLNAPDFATFEQELKAMLSDQS